MYTKTHISVQYQKLSCAPELIFFLLFYTVCCVVFIVHGRAIKLSSQHATIQHGSRFALMYFSHQTWPLRWVPVATGNMTLGFSVIIDWCANCRLVVNRGKAKCKTRFILRRIFLISQMMLESVFYILTMVEKWFGLNICLD